ncbi:MULTISPECIES: hypothetical protein [unclassified Spirosoma]|uniref:hypothetical protein n=1 Tax=unclassified Spirosoma TaxID=2621999 RepID=UPI00095AA23F|nr:MULTISPECIES: hypothetical protein [unclassified Spirosoma]MBN8824995.1 hypothetical protein [Spirosoma sp.]OJW73289.1 MAG: hypothetical protein BGO59_07375 [Spirosoma sp. 48-14]
MKQLIRIGRAFYAVALFVYGCQQIYFGSFRDVFFSVYQQHLPFLNVFAWSFGLYLISTGALLLVPGTGQKAALLLGAAWLSLFLGTHITYELISEPNKLYHLGLWTTPLKELALAGGAFVVADSFDTPLTGKLAVLGKIMPYGNLFFLYTMTSYGISHIIYAPFLVSTVPGWMANPLFWVNLTGVALTASGIGIILGIRIRVISLLLALMIFLWFWLVHVPGALADPVGNRGNLLASAFDALAFSGIALLIGLTMKQQKWVEAIERWR